MPIDRHGRSIHKLRLSLLDACNFRCIYCMPENPCFMPTKDLISRQEIYRIATVLSELGIDEIRVTGGEPSLRSDFVPILEDLSSIGLKKLGLTSNGWNLFKYLPQIKKTKCKHINFSLDSLNSKIFKAMTKSDRLEDVLRSVFTAKELGFKVKVNAVLMKGLNDTEIEDFVEFSAKYDIEVRFLELMRIGVAREHFDRFFVPASSIIERLKKLSPLTTIAVPEDSTSFNYGLSSGANVGIIASESRPFCGGCSRLRISADGILHPCLMVEGGLSLKDKNGEEILQILLKTMGLKPTNRIYDIETPMNQLGG